MECTSSRGGQNSQGKHQTLDPRANSHGADSDTTQSSEGLRWFQNLQGDPLQLCIMISPL